MIKKTIIAFLIFTILISYLVIAKELEYTDYKIDKMGQYDLLNVYGLDLYKFNEELIVPYYVERIYTPASLPIYNIEVNYSEPIELNLNIPIFKIINNIEGAYKKDCNINSFNGPKHTFTIEGFSQDKESIWIEIFPISYNCATQKLIYYKKFDYELIYNKEQNAIVNYEKNIKAKPNSKINISIDILETKTGIIRLIDKYSGIAIEKKLIFFKKYLLKQNNI